MAENSLSFSISEFRYLKRSVHQDMFSMKQHVAQVENSLTGAVHQVNLINRGKSSTRGWGGGGGGRRRGSRPISDEEKARILEEQSSIESGSFQVSNFYDTGKNYFVLFSYLW